jgi:hypothetical protein
VFAEPEETVDTAGAARPLRVGHRKVPAETSSTAAHENAPRPEWSHVRVVPRPDGGAIRYDDADLVRLFARPLTTSIVSGLSR